MAYDTRELAVKITGDATDFVKGQSKVRSETDKSKSSLESFASGAKKTAIAFGAVGAGLTLYAKSATDYTKDLVGASKQMSRETGVSVEEGSRLVYVAQRMGISADQASQVFGVFSKRITSASDDMKKNAQAHEELKNKIAATELEIKQTTEEIKKNGDKTGELSLKVKTLQTNLNGMKDDLNASSNSFEKLGINIKNTDGSTKGFSQLLLETADKFKTMKDGTEKTAIAMDLFGRSGKDLLPLLNKGSAGIQDLEKRADELGITLTSKTVGAIAKYAQSQKDLADSTSALKIQVGTLTAPILTAFNTRLNETLMALLNSNDAVRTVTTGILAFGGPVASGASAVAGFSANLATTIQALGGMRGAMAAAEAFMTGPWGIAIGATVLAAGALTYVYMNQTTNLERLHAAQDATKASLDNLHSAQITSTGAALALEQADIVVRDAQLAYNRAVAQYGPNSDQAKEANLRLRTAINDKARAEENANSALAAMKRAEQEYAKDKSFENAMAAKEDAVRGVDGALNSLQKNVTSQSKSNGGKGNSFGGAGNLIQTLQQAFGHNAQGTDNWGGGLTWVGEKGPELINAPKGSQIIPAEQSASIASGGGSANISLTVNMGMYAGMPIEKRQIALELWKELTRAARAQGVQLPSIGAISLQ